MIHPSQILHTDTRDRLYTHADTPDRRRYTSEGERQTQLSVGLTNEIRCEIQTRPAYSKCRVGPRLKRSERRNRTLSCATTTSFSLSLSPPHLRKSMLVSSANIARSLTRALPDISFPRYLSAATASRIHSRASTTFEVSVRQG